MFFFIFLCNKLQFGDKSSLFQLNLLYVIFMVGLASIIKTSISQKVCWYMMWVCAKEAQIHH